MEDKSWRRRKQTGRRVSGQSGWRGCKCLPREGMVGLCPHLGVSLGESEVCELGPAAGTPVRGSEWPDKTPGC